MMPKPSPLPPETILERIRFTAEEFQRRRPDFKVKPFASFARFMATAKNARPEPFPGRFVLDITSTVSVDQPTAVQRVELELARAFAALAHEQNFGLSFVAYRDGHFVPYIMEDDQVMVKPFGFTVQEGDFQFRPGDAFLIVEMLSGDTEGFLNAVVDARKAGAVINLMIYDLVPLTHPHWVAEEFSLRAYSAFTAMLRISHRLIAVSQKVAEDVACYLDITTMRDAETVWPLPVAHFRLGCDALLRHRKPGTAVSFPAGPDVLLAAGTFKTRKGLLPLLEAMDRLWAEGNQTRLVLVGRDYLTNRTRTQMKTHPELGKRLFLAGYSADAELAEALTQVSAMVIPAFDDGFGLPLVEAAALGCPVVARDVPIYRETSGGDAFFFPDAGPAEMAEKLREFLALPRKKQLKFVPRASLATWRQSAQIMQAILLSSAMAFTVDVGVNASLRLLVPPVAKKPA